MTRGLQEIIMMTYLKNAEKFQQHVRFIIVKSHDGSANDWQLVNYQKTK